jgi:ABC-type transporter Mla subunit MlaD
MTMKQYIHLRAPLALTLLLALAVGCATTTQLERSQRAVSDLQQVTELLKEGDAQLATLNAELRAVSKAKPDDLRDAYADFGKELERTQKLAGTINDTMDDMKDNADQYFTTWKKQAGQLSNKELKALSMDRQQELRQQFDRVVAAAQRLSVAYKSYRAEVQDLQTFLGNDMTRSGSALAKPYITKVLAGGEPLQSALRAAQAEAASMTSILAPK